MRILHSGRCTFISYAAFPYGEVFDSSGNLYVADWNSGVFMIAAGSQQAVPLGLKAADNLQGVAFDE